MTFASGLICILVHCAGMLLLLLVALYFPDKTQSFIGVFATLPLLCSFSVFSGLFLCASFFISSPFPLFIWHRPSAYAVPISFLFLSLLSTLSLSLGAVFVGFRSIEDGEFGCSKQNNLLSAFIISGISGAGQSAERDRRPNKARTFMCMSYRN